MLQVAGRAVFVLFKLYKASESIPGSPLSSPLMTSHEACWFFVVDIWKEYEGLRVYPAIPSTNWPPKEARLESRSEADCRAGLHLPKLQITQGNLVPLAVFREQKKTPTTNPPFLKDGGFKIASTSVANRLLRLPQLAPFRICMSKKVGGQPPPFFT